MLQYGKKFWTVHNQKRSASEKNAGIYSMNTKWIHIIFATGLPKKISNTKFPSMIKVTVEEFGSKRGLTPKLNKTIDLSLP